MREDSLALVDSLAREASKHKRVEIRSAAFPAVLLCLGWAWAVPTHLPLIGAALVVACAFWLRYERRPIDVLKDRIVRAVRVEPLSIVWVYPVSETHVVTVLGIPLTKQTRLLVAVALSDGSVEQRQVANVPLFFGHRTEKEGRPEARQAAFVEAFRELVPHARFGYADELQEHFAQDPSLRSVHRTSEAPTRSMWWNAGEPTLAGYGVFSIGIAAAMFSYFVYVESTDEPGRIWGPVAILYSIGGKWPPTLLFVAVGLVQVGMGVHDFLSKRTDR
jgi:hypothetical protein